MTDRNLAREIPGVKSNTKGDDGIGRGSVTITRRQLESIIWHAIKPPSAPVHFDSVTWDTHKIRFNFHYHDQIRDYKHEGEMNVNVYFHKGTGEPEVLGYDKIKDES